MVRVAALLALGALASGCGLLLGIGGDDAPPRANDAGVDAVASDASLDGEVVTSDASVDASASDASAEGRFCPTFENARHVAELGSAAHDWGPSVTPDGLTVFFSSNRGGDFDIWTATRPARHLPFGAPVAAEVLNTAGRENDPSISADGLAICFDSDRSPPGLYIAKRVALDSPWATPQRIDIPTSMVIGGCELTTDSDEIFLTDIAASPRRLYVTRRPASSDPWGAPIPLALLPPDREEGFPGISPDGLTIMFGGAPLAGFGGVDIYYTTRPSLGAPFGPPVHVAELTTEAQDADPDPSWDGTELWFASDRIAGENYEIYVATPVCP